MASVAATPKRRRGGRRIVVALVILVLIVVGIVVWLWHTQHLFEATPKINPEALVFIPAGFLVGWLISRVVHVLFRQGEPGWYQDVQAWVAILNPGPATAAQARTLLTGAHALAVRRHDRRRA